MKRRTVVVGMMEGTEKIEAAIVAGTAEDTDIGMTGPGAAAAPDPSRTGASSVSEARAGDLASGTLIIFLA